LSSWLDFAGLEHISAQFERLILMTSPIFVIFLGALFFKTPVRMHALVAAALSYAGIAFIFLSGAGGGPGADVPLGTILVLGASIAYAFYQLLAKGVLARLGAWLFTATAMISAGVAVMLHFMITHPLRDLAVTPYVLGLAIAVAIFATVLPTFLIANSIARIGPQATAIVGTISPLCTIGLAVSILGEPFGLPEALGTILVLGGVGFFTYWDTRRAPKIAV
jgi:drug/metabolite transporter (DMT)-like permease